MQPGDAKIKVCSFVLQLALPSDSVIPFLECSAVINCKYLIKIKTKKIGIVTVSFSSLNSYPNLTF